MPDLISKGTCLDFTCGADGFCGRKSCSGDAVCSGACVKGRFYGTPGGGCACTPSVIRWHQTGRRAFNAPTHRPPCHP